MKVGKRHMKNISVYLPMNCGSGNRGCEGIARGTHKILSLDKNRTYLYDFNEKEVALDLFLGLDSVGQLIPYANNTIKNYTVRSINKVMYKIGIKRYLSHIYPYSTIIDKINADDLVLLTGGDLYCYEYHLKKNTAFVQALKRKNKGKIVLWGASIEPSLLDKESIDGLKILDRITVRESLTYEALTNLGISENVELYSDPAFVLEPKAVKLPKCFSDSQIIGINVSNLVNGGNDLNTSFSKNLLKLIEYIISETDMQILLIPHVIWKGQDDRIISKSVAKLFEQTSRVHILEMDTLSYQEIRYVISKCRFFIGGRTHSMISAYSTCVPSIALGYSIKSRGIARDLELPEDLLVDCKKISSEYDLLRAFNFLVESEKDIKNILEKKIKTQRQNSYAARQALKDILF